ncbi:zinc finger transcription factor YY1-like isoform X3 [Durio zibethinus]|uniref:Zinc finger transcription factor YY1-like isoform X3 n=1 Tax=Durio zibethinus TaxID=66656 RepID=A0A6P5XCZ8_DURZI|nr:zinc finger transcription factor YY1-like isoform X3 [Durio zibethinus]
MEMQFAHSLFERRPILKSKAPAVKWFKEWVPQDVVATGGKCMVLKWVNESTSKGLKEKEKEPEAPEPEPEPTTEVLFLCSYEGCGKTFIDAGALRKHSHIHGERQYVCHWEGCGKKFLDSSKLKRHFLIHTGERDFVCPHEGCGKNTTADVTKYATPTEKITKTPKPTGGAYGSASSDRPYACPYEGCEKAYIHEYKLKLHLRREHPGHMSDENAENATTNADNEMDEASDQDAYAGKRVNGKSQKQQSRAKPNVKMPPAKIARQKVSNPSPATLPVPKKKWPVKEEIYEEEDSEETEEDRENVEDGWRYGENNEDDDEETEYED